MMRWLLERTFREGWPGELGCCYRRQCCPAFDVAAAENTADVRSVEVTSDIGTQRSASGGGACQEDEVEGVEAGPSPGGQKPATVADADAVAGQD